MRAYNGKVYEERAPHTLEELQEIVTILRSPEGCAWDSAQTHESLRDCLLDETQEVIMAINGQDDENLCEELGDVLLQVLLHCEIARERGAFTFSDVVQTLSEKMIRRHPHVFGDAERPDSRESALALWKEVKRLEKESKRQS